MVSQTQIDIQKQTDELCINTIRTLSMDAVQQASSGHPGTPMAMAPVVYCLWQRFLRFDPNDAIWPNRDRFVLSIGHTSMLLYSLLHLCEVKAVNAKYEQLGELSVPLEDIQRFRQLDSKCPGHPEYRWTSGVETTTGPLGQGVATSVGMAIAGQWMAQYFNRPGIDLFNYDVYALCGDGCMMEGVSSEAASLAGHLKLSNLCWIYDNNKITIEGHTDWAFSEDVATRFIAYGWNVTRVGNATHDRPTLIIVDSHIAYGAPNKQDTRAAHGEPLGEEEIRQALQNYGWPLDAKFLVPSEVREHFREGLGQRGHTLRSDWMVKFNEYQSQYPELADQLDKMQHRHLPDGWDRDLPTFSPDTKGIAGRDAGSSVLNAIAKNVPWLIGGSADLAPSTKTRLTFDQAGDFTAKNYGGRNFHFGIREHAMGSILNGMALAKVRPYGSGFLIFSDYMKPAIRLAASHGNPGDLHLHARLHRGRRRWADPPARGTAGFVASYPRADYPATRRCQRGGGGLAGNYAAAARTSGSRPLAAGAAHHRPFPIRSGVRCRAGSLCAGRCPGWQARRPAGGHRQRSLSVCQRVRATQDRGHQGPCGEHALVGVVRATKPGVPGQRLPAHCHRPGLCRTSLHLWLGSVCRLEWRAHRHAYLRDLRSAQGTPEEIWLHPR